VHLRPVEHATNRQRVIGYVRFSHLAQFGRNST
jgi:hypothetical protein